jgi:mannose-6-phosphate isomerase class I
LSTEGRAQVLCVLEGEGVLQAQASEVSLRKGEAWLVPGGTGDHTLVGRLAVVRATAN